MISFKNVPNKLITLYIYIFNKLIHRQTVSLYHNPSVWLDPQDASSQDRNLANFTSVGYLTPKPSSFLAYAEEFFTYFLKLLLYLLYNGRGISFYAFGFS